MSVPDTAPSTELADAHVADSLVTPSAPGYVIALGVVSLLFGPTLGALNWLLVTPSIHKLVDLGAGPGSTTTLWIVVWTFIAVGAICFLSGVGLVLGQRWGRWLAYVFVVSAFVGLLIAACGVRVSENLAELEIAERGAIGPGGTSFVQFVAAVPAFAPLYGLVLVVCLNLRRARAWALGRHQRLLLATTSDASAIGVPQSPSASAKPQELSMLALMSMVVSCIPFLLLTQCAALVMGILALRRIKRSEGRLSGRGFAIAGICISSSILLCIGGIIGAAGTFYMLSESSIRLGKSPELIERQRFQMPHRTPMDADPGGPDYPVAMWFSPDSATLLALGSSAGAHLWSASTGEHICQFSPSGRTMAFTSSGQEVVALEHDDTLVAVWYDTQTGSESRRQTLEWDNSPDGLALGRSEPQRAGGFNYESVVLWSLLTGDQVSLLPVPQRPDGSPERLNSMSISSDSQVILLLSEENIYLCDAIDETVLRRFSTDYISNRSAMFAPGGDLAVVGHTGGYGAGAVRVLNLQNGDVEEFDKHRWGALCFDLSADGKLAVSGGRTAKDADYIVINGQRADFGREVIVWEPATRKEIATTYDAEESVVSVAISPDGKLVAAAQRDGTIILFELLR